ncbi:MAG: hypothetical protein WCF84_18485 [Anaerolineae bacterium]
MPILKLGRHDAKRELEFELDYMASFTTSELFAKMVQRSNEIKEMLIRYGHRKPVAIIKRPARALRGRPSNEFDG